mgnify:FL=1
MPIKTILVSLNAKDRADTVLRVACELAREHEAHLIGIYVVPDVKPVAMFEAYLATDFFEEQQKQFNRCGDKMQRLFKKETAKYSLTSEWVQGRAINKVLADDVIALSGQADLIVINQTETWSTTLDPEPDFADRLIMASGRPVLMVPNSGEIKTIGKKVIVGWKPAREAVRALHDALPMLVKSEKVILVTIDTQDASYAEATPSTHQMVEMLRRHGVNAAEQALVISDIPAEEALLNEVAVHGADMIVVGAYGHSRLRELLLGGVTRFLLNHSTVPVLMSH